MPYEKNTDSELVERFKNGEKECFDELFKRYKSRLVRITLRFTGDQGVSEEIAHESFLKFYQNPEKFRGESGIYTYLYRIAINRAKNYIESRARKREDPLYSEGGDSTERSENSVHLKKEESIREAHDKKQLTALLQTALLQLPENTRQAFVLTEIDELSYEDAAKSLGISTGAVGWHVFDARKRLRKILPLNSLEMFFFIQTFSAEGRVRMSLLIENLKITFGVPSSILLSFYLDGQTSRWQSTQIQHLLEINSEFRKEFSDYQKIKVLIGQMETPALAPDFDVRFERKMAAIDEGRWTTDDRRGWHFIPRPSFLVPRLAPVLASALVVLGTLIGYPLLQGQPAKIVQTQGNVEIYQTSTQQWIPASKGFKLNRGMRLRTANDASADIALENRFYVRAKENTEVTFDTLLRSRQKGHVVMAQESGKLLVGLAEGFQDSRFTLKTPFGFAHAYGTVFLVEVLPADKITRVLTLEGTVETEDLLRKQIVPVPPQTERSIQNNQIQESQPLGQDKLKDVEELQSLPQPYGVQKPRGLLEENFSILLVTGPGRVFEFLENPRIYSKRDYPLLTEKVAKARQLMSQAYKESRLELYEELIRELQDLNNQYLDPTERFKPHTQFFIGAIYRYLKRYEEAVKAFENVSRSNSAEWQGIGYLAEGIVLEEDLQQPEKARKVYQQVLAAAPKSTEADEARRRLI